MERNERLKIAIWRKGLTQKQVAEAAGINEGVFSMAINGRFVLDDDQKRKIETYLGERGIFDYAT